MAKKKQAAKEPPWIKRALRYLPAWLFLAAIVVLFILNSTGQNIFPDVGAVFDEDTSDKPPTSRYGGINNTDAPLAPLFTPTVDYWAPAIYRWAQQHQLNPNLIATVIQIESCGHPYIESPAQAQGLFQVVPLYHFEAGENQLDIETNAQAGLAHLQQCLSASRDMNADGVPDQDADVGLTLVCYNGGFGAMYTSPSNWVQESQAYYTWGTGIWADASQGAASSPTLDRWYSIAKWMCDAAEVAIELVDPLATLQ